MKRYLIILPVLFGFFLNGHEPLAFDEWSTQDYIMEAAFLTLHAIDYGQTLKIASNPDRWHEENPVMGKHPSRARVHAVMLSTAVAHVAITHVLPKKFRPYFQGSSIAVKGYFVGKNFGLGIGMAF